MERIGVGNGLDLPTLIKGGVAFDDRGSLSFVNSFDLRQYRRCYTVKNHTEGFIRAWHGHLKEIKALMVITGTALVAAVEMTDTKKPDKDKEVHRFVLSAASPSILVVPAGYVNGFKTLSADAVILIFSSSTLEESQGDDYRFPYDYWNPWQIEQR